jgi:hypothetical protein
MDAVLFLKSIDYSMEESINNKLLPESCRREIVVVKIVYSGIISTNVLVYHG